MAKTSHIEWTDATWNPVTGCSVVSPGCTNCYAMKLAGTRLRHHPSRQGLTQETKAGPVWTGDVRFNREWLDQPLRWKRPRRIFVCAHGDLFHESVPDAWIDQVFAVMALAPRHTFQVLTKRADRMRAYLTDPATPGRIIREAFQIDCEGGAWMSADREIGGIEPLPLPNVWLGVSAEDEARADQRVPHLLRTPAAVRFISYEPALGPLNARRWLPAGRPARRPDGSAFIASHWYMAECLKCGWMGSSELCGADSFGDDSDVYCPACSASGADDGPDAKIDWIIVGGESGPSARPMHPEWVRSLRDDCALGGAALFFKQWGEYVEFEAEGPPRQVEIGSDEAAAILDTLAGPPAWIHQDGRVWRSLDAIPDETPARLMVRVGKARAGRLLDGREHSAMPGAHG